VTRAAVSVSPNLSPQQRHYRRGGDITQAQIVGFAEALRGVAERRDSGDHVARDSNQNQRLTLEKK
jgi:hypothetical protein